MAFSLRSHVRYIFELSESSILWHSNSNRTTRYTILPGTSNERLITTQIDVTFSQEFSRTPAPTRTQTTCFWAGTRALVAAWRAFEFRQCGTAAGHGLDWRAWGKQENHSHGKYSKETTKSLIRNLIVLNLEWKPSLNEGHNCNVQYTKTVFTSSQFCPNRSLGYNANHAELPWQELMPGITSWLTPKWYLVTIRFNFLTISVQSPNRAWSPKLASIVNTTAASTNVLKRCSATVQCLKNVAFENSKDHSVAVAEWRRRWYSKLWAQAQIP